MVGISALSLTRLMFILSLFPSPGRFFAANELKCMMAHIVSTYDIRLEVPGEIPKPEWFSYAVSPNRKAAVLFRKRQS